MRRGLLAAAVLLALCVPYAGAAADETVLVSRATSGAAADGNSNQASVSPDGRHVAFASAANNLVDGENEGVTNVFLRDIAANTTILISRESGAAGPGADADSTIGPASVSSDGRFVAFTSGANNLTTGENEAVNNVFVRDTQLNTTSLVSRETGAASPGGDELSNDATISADGRRIAFSSSANNLSGDDVDAHQNIFVRDTQSDTTVLVSRNSAGTAANGGSVDPMISGNGQFVVFESGATNLGADADNRNDIFRRDLDAGQTTLVSLQSAAAGGAEPDAPSFDPSVSADGNRVAFSSDADNLGTPNPAPFFHIFVRDLAAQQTMLVSRQSDAEGGAQSSGGNDESMIAGDGLRVVFESVGDNLSSADDDAQGNIFVRDLPTGSTILASRQSAADGGAGADDDSSVPSISADGRFVSFQSIADNLSALDNNLLFNIFLRELAPRSGAGGGTTPDTKPPTLELSAKKSQIAGKPVKLQAESDEACTLALAGSAKPKGDKKGKLKPLSDQLAAGVAESLKLKPSAKLKQALAAADKGKAKVAGTCIDAAGNPSQDALKVKLK